MEPRLVRDVLHLSSGASLQVSYPDRANGLVLRGE
jgi:hypothetical protein